MMKFLARMFAGSGVPGSIRARTNTTIMFLLFKTIPEHGEIFEEVSERDLQPGDIVLFPLESSSEKHINVFQHAAVYCGSGEVIHFLAGSNANSLSLISSCMYQGMIVKSGFKALKKERGKCEIYRKKGGVNLNDLHSEIQKAMNSEAKYSLYRNNCIHFALSLLGLEEFYSELVEIQDEGDSSRGVWALWANTRIFGHGDIFEKVSEEDLQPGDIVLCPLESGSEKHVNVFQHAAIYCGSGEVIKFVGSGTQSTCDVVSSKKFRGEIVKSGFKALKNERLNCEIYRKKSGVNLNDLHSEIRKAMNSEAECSLYKNNCIRLALSLLGLEEFYSELVQIQDEGDSSCSGGAVI